MYLAVVAGLTKNTSVVVTFLVICKEFAVNTLKRTSVVDVTRKINVL